MRYLGVTLLAPITQRACILSDAHSYMGKGPGAALSTRQARVLMTLVQRRFPSTANPQSFMGHDVMVLSPLPESTSGYKSDTGIVR